MRDATFRGRTDSAFMSPDQTLELTDIGGGVRLFVGEQPLSEGSLVTPSLAQAHYLLHVMRARKGHRVAVFNGRDGEWLAELREASRRTCTLSCITQAAPQTEVPDLWLVFAPIKRTAADYVAQKATEIGVRLL